MEVLGLNKSQRADLESGCRDLFGVCGSLVLLLCKAHLISEELMEGGKVNGILLGMYGCQVSLGMDGEVGVVSLVGKEWHDPCGSIWSIVICKLSQGRKV